MPTTDPRDIPTLALSTPGGTQQHIHASGSLSPTSSSYGQQSHAHALSLSHSPRNHSSTSLSASVASSNSAGLPHSSSYGQLSSLADSSKAGGKDNGNNKVKKRKLKDVLTELKAKKKMKSSSALSQSGLAPGYSASPSVFSSSSSERKRDREREREERKEKHRQLQMQLLQQAAGIVDSAEAEEAIPIDPSPVPTTSISSSPRLARSVASQVKTAHSSDSTRHKRTLSKSISDNNLLGLVASSQAGDVAGLSISQGSDWPVPSIDPTSCRVSNSRSEVYASEPESYRARPLAATTSGAPTTTTTTTTTTSSSPPYAITPALSVSAAPSTTTRPGLSMSHSPQSSHRVCFDRELGSSNEADRYDTDTELSSEHHAHPHHQHPHHQYPHHHYPPHQHPHHQHAHHQQQSQNSTETEQSEPCFDYNDFFEDDEDFEYDESSGDNDEHHLRRLRPTDRRILATAMLRAANGEFACDDELPLYDAHDLAAAKLLSKPDQKPPLPFLEDMTRVSNAYAKGIQIPAEDCEEPGSTSRYARLLALPRMAGDSIHKAGSNITNLPRLAGQGFQKAGQGFQKASEGFHKAGSNIANLPKLASEGFQKAGTNIASLPKLAGEGIQRAGSGIQKAGANIVNLPMSLTENMKQHMNSNERSFWMSKPRSTQAIDDLDAEELYKHASRDDSGSISSPSSPTAAAAAQMQHRARSISSNDPRLVIKRESEGQQLLFDDIKQRRPQGANDKRNRKDLKQMKETLEGLEKNVHSSMVEQLEDLGDDIEQHVCIV
jgi:hypothetical protein